MSDALVVLIFLKEKELDFYIYIFALHQKPKSYFLIKLSFIFYFEKQLLISVKYAFALAIKVFKSDWRAFKWVVVKEVKDSGIM